MKKAVKAFYLLIVGLVVFLGGLLMVQGAAMPDEPAAVSGPAATQIPPIDDMEGSAV